MAAWEKGYDDSPDYMVGSCIPLASVEYPPGTEPADAPITAKNWGAAQGDAHDHYRNGVIGDRSPLEKAAIDSAIARLDLAVAAKRRAGAEQVYTDAVRARNDAGDRLNIAIDNEAEQLA